MATWCAIAIVRSAMVAFWVVELFLFLRRCSYHDPSYDNPSNSSCSSAGLQQQALL